MGVSKINLTKSSAPKASGSKITDFALGKERLEKLESVIAEADTLEFWSPKYQAWRKLLEWYLSSGNNPVLAQTKLLPILHKEDWLAVPEGELTPIFRDIVRMKNTSGTELFRDIYYNTLEDFCKEQCWFFTTQSQRIWREIHQPNICTEIMTGLVEGTTYRSMMCAVLFFRENQATGLAYPPELLAKLQAKVDAWRNEFLAEFKAIQEMLSDKLHLYSWYCDTVFNAIKRAWDNALVLHNRPLLVTAEENMSLSKDVAADLQGYLSASPVGIGPNFLDTASFDALYQIYYNNDSSAPDNNERCFYALCVPHARFKWVIDNLYDFYWCVMDGLLSSAMYARICVAFQKNKDAIDPVDYQASLAYRGYPDLK